MNHYSDGYLTGLDRGHEDTQAETDGVNLRLPTHAGLVGQPPPGLDPQQEQQWVDGFLDGYAEGRSKAMRGEAA